jgi:ribosomal subunit interface protein
MKITYTGLPENFPPALLQKVEAQLVKLGKVLDGRGGEREARVVLTRERHLQHAEVTLNYYDHPLVGIASDADTFTALHDAVAKLEKQALRVREKWRDTKRGSKPETGAGEVETAEV